MVYEEDYIPPIQETVAHKTDVLDWDWIADQKCDLEYRLPFTVPLSTYAWVGLQLATVSAVAFPLGRLVGVTIAPILAPGMIGLISALFGAALAIGYVLQQDKLGNTDSLWPLVPGLAARTCGPPIAWLAVVCTDRLGSFGGAYVYLIIALPFAVVAFDRLAAHIVYWSTANLFVSPSEAATGRAAWQNRLKPGTDEDRSDEGEAPDPTIESAPALGGYVTGTAWLLGAYILPQTFIALSGRGLAPTLGLELVAASLAGLCIAALYRIGGDLRIVGLFFRMLAHWFYYGEATKLAPWLFHSPCGRPWQRRALICLAIAFLSLHSTSLAAHSLRLLPLDQPWVIPSSSVNPDWLTQLIEESPNWLNRVLWVAPAIVFAFGVPLWEFFLVGLILIGPVLAAYHRRYDDSQGEPT